MSFMNDMRLHLGLALIVSLPLSACLPVHYRGCYEVDGFYTQREDTLPTTRRLQDMADGDAVRVIITSIGCFACSRYEILIDSQRKALVYRLYPYRIVKRRRIGTVRLGVEQLEQMDEVLTFLRKRKQGGCTNIDYVEVGWLQDGALVETERYVDATCVGYHMGDRMTFHALINRARSR